ARSPLARGHRHGRRAGVAGCWASGVPRSSSASRSIEGQMVNVGKPFRTGACAVYRSRLEDMSIGNLGNSLHRPHYEGPAKSLRNVRSTHKVEAWWDNVWTADNSLISPPF